MCGSTDHLRFACPVRQAHLAQSCAFVGARLTSSDVSSTVTSTLSFQNTESIIALMLTFAFAVLALILSALVRRVWTEASIQTFRVEGGFPPDLRQQEGHRWHLFLSHIWSTGTSARAR